MELDFWSEIYCKDCCENKPGRTLMSRWSQLSIGTIKNRIEVWCKRHDVLIYKKNFEMMSLKYEEN